MTVSLIPKRGSFGTIAQYLLDALGNVIGFVGPNGETISGAAPSYTWAGKPAAAAGNAGSIIRITNIGRSGFGTLWISDGTRWMPLTGSAFIARNAIPVIFPSSGAIGNNGALTLTTALPQTYAACYMYFPANAISAGSAAGVYYVEMSSTTVGVIYNNTYTAGDVTIPTSKTAFATTGPGAYTQTTGSDISLLAFTIPGGALGLYGGIRYFSASQNNNSAGVKTLKAKFGTFALNALAPTTSITAMIKSEFSNRGSESVQQGWGYDSSSGFSTGNGNALVVTGGTVNSASDQTAAITGQLATATDYLILMGGTLEITG